MSLDVMDDGVTSRLRSVLLGLARRENDVAAAEAATVPYWKSCPISVQAHRIAAEVLRNEADQLLVTRNDRSSGVSTANFLFQ